LLDLSELGNKLIKNRDQIEKRIYSAFALNHNSQKCKEFALIFIEYFDIQMRRSKDFVNYGLIKKKHNTRMKIDVNINLFSNTSCIIFISLLIPIGKVKRLTSSFKNVFGLPKEVKICFS
jgi:hypothetical protein